MIRFSNMDAEDRVDPMSRVFPRMTKCIFHKYGGSGTIQRFDALCVLGMNILNEKVLAVNIHVGLSMYRIFHEVDIIEFH